MTKGKIILVPFPFDDFSETKVRPAICLTDEIGFYNHIIIAFISSQILHSLEDSDLLIEMKNKDFKSTGLSVNSVVKLHRLVTISKSLIKRQLGVLPPNHQKEIEYKLKTMFEL